MVRDPSLKEIETFSNLFHCFNFTKHPKTKSALLLLFLIFFDIA